nr:hypothetical protein [uncultured Flavobacterium sp.]
MKYSLLLVSFLTFCICDFDGKYSKVIWNNEKQLFENSNINLGEFLISPVIENCSIQKGKLSIGGSIFLRNKDEQFTYVVIDCSMRGKILDTLFMGKQDKKFEVTMEHLKQKFIVIKKIDEADGLKYEQKSFR